MSSERHDRFDTRARDSRATFFLFFPALGYGGEEHGPRFVVEPPVSIFFSNATGARVECAAEGAPRPLVRWQTARDGSTVRDVGDLMRVDGNGTLVFSPFAEHRYTPDVHSAAYRCVAHSRAGTIVSRTVHVRAGKYGLKRANESGLGRRIRRRSTH